MLPYCVRAQEEGLNEGKQNRAGLASLCATQSTQPMKHQLPFECSQAKVKIDFDWSLVARLLVGV